MSRAIQGSVLSLDGHRMAKARLSHQQQEDTGAAQRNTMDKRHTRAGSPGKSGTSTAGRSSGRSKFVQDEIETFPATSEYTEPQTEP